MKEGRGEWIHRKVPTFGALTICIENETAMIEIPEKHHSRRRSPFGRGRCDCHCLWHGFTGSPRRIQPSGQLGQRIGIDVCFVHGHSLLDPPRLLAPGNGLDLGRPWSNGLFGLLMPRCVRMRFQNVRARQLFDPYKRACPDPMLRGEAPVKLYFDDEDFDGQLQRSVGKADSGMANVGECLAIAERITPGDRDSWYRAWSDFAGQLATTRSHGPGLGPPCQCPQRAPSCCGVLPPGILLPSG